MADSAGEKKHKHKRKKSKKATEEEESDQEIEPESPPPPKPGKSFLRHLLDPVSALWSCHKLGLVPRQSLNILVSLELTLRMLGQGVIRFV